MRAERAAVVALAAWCAPAAAPVVPRRCAPARRARAASRAAAGIALTFDDGPHREGTPAVLARARARPARPRRSSSSASRSSAARAGAPRSSPPATTIGIHGYRHVLLLRRSPRAPRATTSTARRDVIARGDRERDPTLYRPPYGVFSAPGAALVRRLGWSPFLWSRWGRDWERARDARSRSRRGRRAIWRGGDVVLLHDADHYSSAGSWRRTAAALPSVLAATSADRRVARRAQPLEVARDAVDERRRRLPPELRGRPLARDVARSGRRPGRSGPCTIGTSATSSRTVSAICRTLVSSSPTRL